MCLTAPTTPTYNLKIVGVYTPPPSPIEDVFNSVDMRRNIFKIKSENCDAVKQQKENHKDIVYLIDTIRKRQEKGNRECEYASVYEYMRRDNYGDEFKCKVSGVGLIKKVGLDNKYKKGHFFNLYEETPRKRMGY